MKVKVDDDMQKYRKGAMIISVIGLILFLTGVTYSFFNYTKTGNLNNLGTGTINFNSSQSDTLNVTNYFPMTSTEAANANLDAVTITIEGDTTYADGEEFVITISDIRNTYNNKQVPLNFIATYEAATGGSIGTSNSDYWEDRNDKDSNIYILNSGGSVKEGRQVLAGYIKSGETGVNGILTLSTYIDADRIAISDTYTRIPERYIINPQMTEEELAYCISIFDDGFIDDATSFCNGTGTLEGIYLITMINEGILDQTGIDYLLENNVIIPSPYTNGTPTEWVDRRVVFTTNEWNSFGTIPISFKIKVESNEGIWVDEPGKIDSCEGCKFIYASSEGGQTTWNTNNKTPSVITTGLYDNYEDLMAATRTQYFMGVKLNNQNQVTNAYVCAERNNIPFCLEGTSNGAAHNANRTILQTPNLYDDLCYEYDDGNENSLVCQSFNYWEALNAETISSGRVIAFVGLDNNYCIVYENGLFSCTDIS